AGGSWSVDNVPPVTGGSFSGVSCVSQNFCIVVGTLANADGDPVVLRWDGGSWSVEQVPGSGNLESRFVAVSCASRSFCMALGLPDPEATEGSTVAAATPNGTIADRWNGHGWSSVSVPGGDLSGLSCASPTACMAVGNGSAERWDGRRWSLAPAPKMWL